MLISGKITLSVKILSIISDAKGFINVKAIAKSLDVSVSYVEQFVAPMRTKGIIKSQCGPGGGYFLSKPAFQITIASVVDAIMEGAVQGGVDLVCYENLKTVSLEDIMKEEKKAHAVT